MTSEFQSSPRIGGPWKRGWAFQGLVRPLPRFRAFADDGHPQPQCPYSNSYCYYCSALVLYSQGPISRFWRAKTVNTWQLVLYKSSQRQNPGMSCRPLQKNNKSSRNFDPNLCPNPDNMLIPNFALAVLVEIHLPALHGLN